ncbi:MAG: Hsp20/alpha crystallin family protein [Anaerolineae bacterium]|nr:Hsp20/alpha crystallin family protein [Anaerolineae bacterium]MCO5187002.1 Hsp20/alpha crystallin family protein [Anaerolineae bacterium]MCO5191951.1 Hsp20/alpha crystallin family protein [Anaerolineae bacterium]MCO5197768.1 Hsp20/alpha crystallin family protein [Anaerolineae bacterium]MCO5207689.1 Hsp20/alpha crystallin family protein [Anaerolineae bacterium]
MLWRPTYQPLFRDLMRLNREMDRTFGLRQTNGSSFTPPINIWMNEEDMIVSAELPGFDAASMDISVENNVLSISGDRETAAADVDGKTLRRERYGGGFNRSINLPYRVELDAINANFSNGVLTIELPRAAEDKPRKITITSA